MSRFHWSEAEIAYFEELVKGEPLPTHIIIRRMGAQFGREFTRASVCRRLRANGIPYFRTYSAAIKEGFAAFIRQHPGLTSYSAAKAFNAKTGADISGQLAHYWRQKGVA